MKKIWGNKKSDDSPNDELIKGPMSAPFDMQDRVEISDNRIYYYADVSEESVLALNKMVHNQVHKAKVHSAVNDIPVQSCGHVKIHIQSYGGSVFSGLSAMDTILEAGKVIPITTVVDGCAASAATFISIAGTKRLMRKNSYMLIHQLSSGFWGKYDEFKDEITNLDQLMSTIRKMYEEYTSVPVRELDKILKRDLWWDAAKCKKFNLIDEIV